MLRVIYIHVSVQKSAFKNQAQNANSWSNWWKGLKFNAVFYPITHISISNQSIGKKRENRSEAEDIYYGNVEMNLYPERNFSFPPAPQRTTADNASGLCQMHCTELILMKWLSVSSKLNTMLLAKIFVITQRRGSQFPLIFNIQAIICFHFLIALISHFVGKLALSRILKDPSMMTNK